MKKFLYNLKWLSSMEIEYQRQMGTVQRLLQEVKTMAKALTVKELDLLDLKELANDGIRAEIRKGLEEREELLKRVAELEGLPTVEEFGEEEKEDEEGIKEEGSGEVAEGC
jgi:hypothetical protein